MSVDLIYPGKETGLLVQGLDDNWIIFGPVRATMHLVGAWWRLEPEAFKRETPMAYTKEGHYVFGPTYKDHPWARWAAESERNYAWLYFFAQDMCEEHARRFPNAGRHGITRMLKAMEEMPHKLPEGVWTPPEFATHVEFKE